MYCVQQNGQAGLRQAQKQERRLTMNIMVQSTIRVLQAVRMYVQSNSTNRDRSGHFPIIRVLPWFDRVSSRGNCNSAPWKKKIINLVAISRV